MNQKKSFLAKCLVFISIFLVITTSCTDDSSDPAVSVEANFSSNTTSIKVGESISFTDQSTGSPTSWVWTFEGGTPATSNEQNPTITYSGVGTFNVTLTVTNQSSENTALKDDYITVTEDVIADFSFSSSSVLEGESITFTDNSTGNPTEWNWEFEGGTPATSQDQNPVISYSKPGYYSVTLTATNESSSNTITKERIIHITCEGNYCEPVFTTYTTTPLTYGVDPDGHKMIIYEADGDSRTDRPVVVLMGGGGFEGTNLDLLDPVADNLVKHGVLVALIEYRVLNTDDGTTELVNGQQDCRTAVRYLKKEAATLGISPDQIFIGGNGSGAFAALYHAYVDESDLTSAQLNVINDLGGLEGIDQGNSGFTSEVAGAISLAGGMYQTLDVITSADVPLFAIHGTADTEVPYDFESTTPPTYGSKRVVEKVNSVGLIGILYTIDGGGHTAPRENSDDYILDLMYFIRDIVQ